MPEWTARSRRVGGARMDAARSTTRPGSRRYQRPNAPVRAASAADARPYATPDGVGRSNLRRRLARRRAVAYSRWMEDRDEPTLRVATRADSSAIEALMKASARAIF